MNNTPGEPNIDVGRGVRQIGDVVCVCILVCRRKMVKGGMAISLLAKFGILRARISCSIAVKLAVVARGTEGQVIAGLTSPIMQFAESYLSLYTFPLQT